MNKLLILLPSQLCSLAGLRNEISVSFLYWKTKVSACKSVTTASRSFNQPMKKGDEKIVSGNDRHREGTPQMKLGYTGIGMEGSISCKLESQHDYDSKILKQQDKGGEKRENP